MDKQNQINSFRTSQYEENPPRHHYEPSYRHYEEILPYRHYELAHNRYEENPPNRYYQPPYIRYHYPEKDPLYEGDRPIYNESRRYENKVSKFGKKMIFLAL